MHQGKRTAVRVAGRWAAGYLLVAVDKDLQVVGVVEGVGSEEGACCKGIQSKCYVASRHASSNLPSTLATLATLATLTAFEQPRLLPGRLAQRHHLRVKVRGWSWG